MVLRIKVLYERRCMVDGEGFIDAVRTEGIEQGLARVAKAGVARVRYGLEITAVQEHVFRLGAPCAKATLEPQPLGKVKCPQARLMILEIKKPKQHQISGHLIGKPAARKPL